MNIQAFKRTMPFRLLCSWILVSFVFTSLIQPKQAHAQSLNLPVPGTMVNLSQAYEPVMIKGLTIHKDNPFLFNFIVDIGQDKMSGEPLKQEGEKLIKYFLAALAIPDKDLWVNLSPYEKNKIVPEALGQTEMGRELLAQDYLLKQITATLIYPEKELGKKFWDKVYTKAQKVYGTTEVPVNTFNKVWIMADRAEVFEHNQTVFVTDSHLKVMLEEDYLALSKQSLPKQSVGADLVSARHHPKNNSANQNTANEIIREIILPELEKEVNTGKNFANLRQVFNSIILASWYKDNLKQALLNQVYTGQSKVKGINVNDPTFKQQIYDQYLKAYKKGVFNYIKEDVTTTKGVATPRKYFSGGIANLAMTATRTTKPDRLGAIANGRTLKEFHVGIKAGFVPSSQAMITSELDRERIIKQLVKDHSKNNKFKDLSDKDILLLISELQAMAPSGSFFKPFVDLIVMLLAEKKDPLRKGPFKKTIIQIQRGSVAFFKDLQRHGIDVEAVNFKNTIIVKSERAEVIIRQIGERLGLASSTIDILVKMSTSAGAPLQEVEQNQIKNDMEAVLEQKNLRKVSDIIPPMAIAATLAIILTMAAVGVDPQLKIKVVNNLHVYVGALVLGYHQFKGLHQIVYGQTATEFLEGKEPKLSKKTTYSLLALGLTAAVALPGAMMSGSPFWATGCILGLGAPAMTWGLRNFYAEKFRTGKAPTLPSIAQNYKEFRDLAVRYPAGAAIILLITGTALTSYGNYQLSEHVRLTAAYFFLGLLAADGISRWTPFAFSTAEASKQAALDGKVTEKLRNTIGNKMTNAILLSKPYFYIAYWGWMLTLLSKTGAEVLQPLAGKLDSMAAQSMPFFQNHTWHPLPYLLLVLMGATFAGSFSVIDKVKEVINTRRALKEARVSEKNREIGVDYDGDEAMSVPEAIALFESKITGLSTRPFILSREETLQIKAIIEAGVMSNDRVAAEFFLRHVDTAISHGNLWQNNLTTEVFINKAEEILKASEVSANSWPTDAAMSNHATLTKAISKKDYDIDGLEQALTEALTYPPEHTDDEPDTLVVNYNNEPVFDDIQNAGTDPNYLASRIIKALKFSTVGVENGSFIFGIVNTPTGKTINIKDAATISDADIKSMYDYLANSSGRWDFAEYLLEKGFSRTELLERSVSFGILIVQTNQVGLAWKDKRDNLLGGEGETYIVVFDETSFSEFIKGLAKNHMDLVQKFKKDRITDSAQITDIIAPNRKGGIDLNTTSGMRWKMRTDGKGVEMGVDAAMIERVRRQGVDWVSPVIFRVTPVASIWSLVELPEPPKEVLLAGV